MGFGLMLVALAFQIGGIALAIALTRRASVRRAASGHLVTYRRPNRTVMGIIGGFLGLLIAVPLMMLAAFAGVGNTAQQAARRY